jgi:hypothetical protein
MYEDGSMTTIHIKGVLTQDGKIELELPEGWQPGEVSVEINVEPAFTDEELDELLQSNPKPANPIVTGGWEDLDIRDSVAFVEEMRRKRRERNQW